MQQARLPNWNRTPSLALFPGVKRERTSVLSLRAAEHACKHQERDMNQLIYLVGLIVVVLFILSFFGLR